MRYKELVVRYSKWVVACFSLAAIVTSWIFWLKPYELKRLQVETEEAAHQFTFDFSSRSALSLDEVAALFHEVAEADSEIFVSESLTEAFQTIEGLQAFVLPKTQAKSEVVLYNPYVNYTSSALSKKKCDKARAARPDTVIQFHNVSVVPVGGSLCVYNPSATMVAILDLKATLHAALEEETMKGYFSMLMEEALPELSLPIQLNKLLYQTPYKFLGTQWAIYVYPSQAYVESRMKRVFLKYCVALLGALLVLGWWLGKYKLKSALSIDEVEHLKQLALYDGVTNLPNRRHCLNHINASIRQAEALGRKFALCFMDCNGFKKINDTYGHPVGDQVLRHIADEVSSTIRKHDFFARYSGDEFCLILKDTAAPQDIDTALSKIIEALNAPIFVGEGTLSVSMSIGVALYPKHGKTAEELIRHADKVMYEAKRTGEKRYLLATES